MNEELEAKGFITITGRISRKYYEAKFYGMAQTNQEGGEVMTAAKMKSVEQGMYLSTIMTGLVRIAGKLRGDLRPNGKRQNGNSISA